MMQPNPSPQPPSSSTLPLSPHTGTQPGATPPRSQSQSQSSSTSTLYIPIEGPPTPCASPPPPPLPFAVRPIPIPDPGTSSTSLDTDITSDLTTALNAFAALPQHMREPYLSTLISSHLTPFELSFLASRLSNVDLGGQHPTITHTSVDFLAALPLELALHILRFLVDPLDLVRASTVSQRWRNVVQGDEWGWRRVCGAGRFWVGGVAGEGWDADTVLDEQLRRRDAYDDLPTSVLLPSAYPSRLLPAPSAAFLYRDHFRESYIRHMNWLKGGKLLRSHRTSTTTNPGTLVRSSPPQNTASALPSSASASSNALNASTAVPTTTTTSNSHLPIPNVIPHAGAPNANPQGGTGTQVVTSLALSARYAVIGLASWKIHVFDLRTGGLVRSLVGHEGGVWGVWIVEGIGGEERGGERRAGRGGEGGNGQVKGKGKGSAERTERKQTPTATVYGDDREDDGALERFLPPALRTALGLDVHLPFSDPSSPPSSGSRSPSASASPDRDPWTSPPTASSPGWTQPATLVLSVGCDKVLRVWDVATGVCVYALSGHRGTVRCLGVFPTPAPRPRYSTSTFGSGSVPGGLSATPMIRMIDPADTDPATGLANTNSNTKTRTVPLAAIAITGSRDATLRVWDVRRGKCLRVLKGHTDSVRCLDMAVVPVLSSSVRDEGLGDEGNEEERVERRAWVVSGSYDRTVRLWDISTGTCLRVFRGHLHQIYCVAFDGHRIASGGMDTTVRVWDAHSGDCLALLQAHTALVSSIQIFRNTLASAGSDGRVTTFALPPTDNNLSWGRRGETAASPAGGVTTTLGFPFPTATPSSRNPASSSRPTARSNSYSPSNSSPPPYATLRKIPAHDATITSLQLTDHFILTGSTDGHACLFDRETGAFVREVTDVGDGVWRVLCNATACWEGGGGGKRADRLVVACKRAGRTVVEIWAF